MSVMFRFAVVATLLTGCAEETTEDSKVAARAIHKYESMCKDNIIFSNSSKKEFVVTKIIRENKLKDANLKIENTIIWGYRGHQTSKNFHTIDKGLILSPGEELICDHKGHLMTILGHFRDVTAE